MLEMLQIFLFKMVCPHETYIDMIIQKMGQEEFHGTKNHGFYVNNEDFSKYIILLDEFITLIISSYWI